MLSAGCAIGCGNVWKFPYLAGENGGGAFVFLYIIFIIILGIPVLTMEFSLGRGSQKSPIYMLAELQPQKKIWGFSGYISFLGNLLLMMFYTVVAGWFLNFFVGYADGQYTGGNGLASAELFDSVISSPSQNIIYMAIVVAIGFFICSFKLQNGLERIIKYMMIILFVLMIVMAIRTMTLSGASEGLSFFLLPDFSEVTWSTVNAAMNQAFFTLSLGIGTMAIFGSYLDKNRALMGESIYVIILDTLVAIVAGLIIFPACATYGVDPGSGPGLIFQALPEVFANMEGGRLWGALFFLFMTFAAFSTVFAVFENLLSMLREKTGWSRKKGSIICGIGIFILSVPCALGYNVWSGFQPFAAGSTIKDIEDFIVSNILLPIGSLVFIFFCTSKSGWGWENFLEEANTGNGPKLKNWMKPYMKYVLPLIVMVVFVAGLITFEYA